MGSGIAAQLCNANVSVTLLDLKTEISEKAKKRIFESRPPLLIDKSKIDNIKVGNIDKNFDTVAKADWVVEAVVERIDIKHNLYEKILKKWLSLAQELWVAVLRLNYAMQIFQ